MITAKEARLLATKNNLETDMEWIEDIFKQIEETAKSGGRSLSSSLNDVTIATRITLTYLIEDNGFRWENHPTRVSIYW